MFHNIKDIYRDTNQKHSPDEELKNYINKQSEHIFRNISTPSDVDNKII